MRAALILRLARTRRTAMICSVTRKDLATSLVERPPSSRRVSATWASVDRAGWQQVKMRRSRSSSTGPASSGMPGSLMLGERTATSLSSSRPRDSRRRRSMARLRAVVVIQPPGLGGRPSPGHLDAAMANASCTASSATSMSPKARIRAATDRPDSSRKIRPISASPVPRTPSGPGFVLERPDLDRSPDDGARLGRPDERCIEILSGDDVEAAEVFPRLREWPVGRQHLAAGHAHDGGGAGFVQATAEDPRARRLHLRLQGHDLLVGLPHLLVDHRLASLAIDAVDGQQVLRHGDPPHGRALPASHSGYERVPPRLTPTRENSSEADGAGPSLRRARRISIDNSRILPL